MHTKILKKEIQESTSIKFLLDYFKNTNCTEYFMKRVLTVCISMYILNKYYMYFYCVSPLKYRYNYSVNIHLKAVPAISRFYTFFEFNVCKSIIRIGREKIVLFECPEKILCNTGCYIVLTNFKTYKPIKLSKKQLFYALRFDEKGLFKIIIYRDKIPKCFKFERLDCFIGGDIERIKNLFDTQHIL